MIEGDTASGAFGHGHDALGDAMIGVGGEPRFPAAAFLEQALADLVFKACSLVRGRRLRCRTRLKPSPQNLTPSLVVAMLAIPRSTPRNPPGSTPPEPGTSQVA